MLSASAWDRSVSAVVWTMLVGLEATQVYGAWALLARRAIDRADTTDGAVSPALSASSSSKAGWPETPFVPTLAARPSMVTRPSLASRASHGSYASSLVLHRFRA